MSNVFSKNRSGFTLIEMLIVVSIVGIIAVLAVSSYGNTQRQARLSLTVDSLITSFQEQMGKAKNGQRAGTVGDGSERGFYCFGLQISKEKPLLQYLSAPYIVADQQNADYCSGDIAYIPFEDFENLGIQEIQVDETTLDSVTVFFKPPSGKAVVNSAGQFLPFSKVKITVGYPNQPGKTIEFDSLTGRTSVVNVSH